LGWKKGGDRILKGGKNPREGPERMHGLQNRWGDEQELKRRDGGLAAGLEIKKTKVVHGKISR